MRKIIMALVAVLLLCGAGAGGYFFFLAPEAEASAGDQAKGGHDVAKKDEHNEHTEFVELDPLVLPILDYDGVSQTVSVVVALEVHDPEAAAKVNNLKPKLTDAYIEDMYGVLSEHAAFKGGALQVSMIKKRLSSITDHVLGEDTVHDVLLQVVQQRPI